MAQPATLASYNGRLIDEADATLHALSPAVKYASALFEGCRAYWCAEERQLYAFRLADHIDRLFDGLRILRFETEVDRPTLTRWALDLIAATGLREDLYFRILAFIDGRGDQGARGPVSFIVTVAPLGRGREFEAGFKLGVSSWVRVADRAMPPRVKCIANYHNGRLGILDAQQQGFDYPLFLTEGGKVAETAGSCLFLVKKGAVVTPSVTSDILESITRDCAIRLLREREIAVIERAVDRSETYLAEEAFVTGTHQEICPVVAIDGLPIGEGRPGPLVRALQSRFLELVEGRSPDPYGWRRPIPLPESRDDD
ncbi:MAG: branched-chain amino acid transaminase [Rhodospirillales bacterium]